MPRRQVQFAPGGTYHIYNRGIGGQPIFSETDNYLYVLRAMKDYTESNEITLIAYCLMPNHYHMLLRQDGTTSAGMLPQRVFNAYVKAYNKRYDRQGSLFQGRFRAVQVDTEGYLIHLCCYIHANPAKAGLVTQVGDWPYSNYPEWIGTREGTLVDRDLVEAYFPDRADYRAYVESYVAGTWDLPDATVPYLLDPGDS